MREKYLVGFIGENPNVPTPVDLVDFVVDWEGEQMLLALKFCPFCGKKIEPNAPLRDPRQPKQSD